MKKAQTKEGGMGKQKQNARKKTIQYDTHRRDGGEQGERKKER